MISRPAKSSGFTLLELLVAVAVLGMLLVLLNQGVAFGLRVTAMQDRRDWAAELPAADAALRSLIAQADPGIYPEPPAFEGTLTSIALQTELPGPDGARQPVDAFLYANDGQLRLRWTRHRHVDRFGPPASPQEVTLFDGVGSVHFDYYSKAQRGWQTAWHADTLPALVRVELVFVQPSRHWPPLIIAPRREPLEQ